MAAAAFPVILAQAQVGQARLAVIAADITTLALDAIVNAANTSLRSQYRTAVKNVEKAVLAGDKTKATELFGKMQSVVDIIADKHIFHKNKAARDKSRLAAKVKTLALAA